VMQVQKRLRTGMCMAPAGIITKVWQTLSTVAKWRTNAKIKQV